MSAGPWRPLFKPSQILKTEFPEHESFHEDVDSQYRNMVDDDRSDNSGHSRSPSPSPSSSADDHAAAGSDSSDSGDFSSVSDAVGGLAKKHNHMIHLHLIPHIYVPVMHSSGYAEVKNYHATAPAEDGLPPSSPIQQPDFGSEFNGGGGQTGPATSGLVENAAGDHDHGNYNGHSGETAYYTINEDAAAAVRQHSTQDVNFGNSIDNDDQHHHDYHVPPSSSKPDEPHQYQVYKYCFRPRSFFFAKSEVIVIIFLIFQYQFVES